MIWVMESKIMILLLDRTHPVAHWQLHGGKVTVKAIQQKWQLPDGGKGAMDTVLFQALLTQEGDPGHQPQVVVFSPCSKGFLPAG